MKSIRFIWTLLLSVVLLSACSNEELQNIADNTEFGKIHFRIGGAALNSSTRAGTIEADENESYVNSITALLWSIENGYVGAVDATPSGTPGEYDMVIEDDDEFLAVFIANAGEQMREQIENLEKGKGKGYNTAERIQQLHSIYSEQAPDGQYFLMSSPETYNFSTSITGKKDIGTVLLRRECARFDVVNQADGVKVNKITFNNRTIYSNLRPSNPWEKTDAWYDTRTYTPDNLIGNSDITKAGKFQKAIYSYRNYSTDNSTGKLPSLTIEYEQEEDGATVRREHIVEFIDSSMPNNTALAIKQNTLYTITLKKAHKLEFELSVSDWDEAEPINISDLRINDLNIPLQEQQRLNNLLKVNMFTEYNVKSLNLQEKKVEFADKLTCDPNDYSTGENGSYFNYTTIKPTGLATSDPLQNIITDADGNKYRIPTAGEAGLLFPWKSSYILGTELEKGVLSSGAEVERNDNIDLVASGIYTPSYSAVVTSSNSRKFVDIISFKNASDNKIVMLNYPCEESEGLSTTVEWTLGYEPLYLGVAKDLFGFRDPEEWTTSYTYRPAYAIRFKGTSQYAAYKYEMILIDNDPKKVYGSVKIKALPADLDVSVFEITDNEEYWKEGYIEYTFPCIGIINDDGKLDVGTWAVFLTSSISPVDKYIGTTIIGGFTRNAPVVTPQVSSKRKMPLRLVKVSDTTETSGEQSMRRK